MSENELRRNWAEDLGLFGGGAGMSEKLKPCPFCGGKAITSTFFDWDDLDYMAFEVNDNESIDGEVTCENERCINGWYLSPKDWNTRPIEDALTARIAELEEKQRWRVVADGELPEDGKPVWVCTIWNEQHSGLLIDGVWGGLFRDFREGEITHWMPLPESPNDTQTQTFVYGKDVSRSVK